MKCGSGMLRPLDSLQLDYFLIRETKLDESFLSAQFAVESYKIRTRRDRDRHGGGLIQFLKRVKIYKRVKQFETAISKSIFPEITISRKKLFCTGIYWAPNVNNIDTFFKEVGDSLGKATLTCKNFIIMGDFNIAINTAEIEVDKLNKFCNLFDLTNLIKTETC